MLRLTAIAASVAAAAAWWCDGHMLVAQIAYANLSGTSQTKADQLISTLAQTYPESPDFVTSACWADDLKSDGVTQYNNWHFVDLPVIRGAIWNDVPAVGNTSINPWAVNLALATLSSPYSTQLDQAIQLRFLIHFVGDLHQPLHAASLFSAQFPTGDYGGNAYKIAGANQTNLHSLWDSGINRWADDIDRPLNATGQAWLAAWQSTIVSAYPSSSFGPQLAESDPFLWAGESNSIANSFVYNVPQTPTPVPQNYLDAAFAYAQSQVALGGYRLAQAIESVLNPQHPAFIARQQAELAAARALAAAPASQPDSPAALRGGRN